MNVKRSIFTITLLIFSAFAVAAVPGPGLVPTPPEPTVFSNTINDVYVTGHDSMVNLGNTPASAASDNILSMATSPSSIPDDSECMATCKETDNRFISALGSNYIERLAAIPIGGF